MALLEQGFADDSPVFQINKDQFKVFLASLQCQQKPVAIDLRFQQLGPAGHEAGEASWQSVV